LASTSASSAGHSRRWKPSGRTWRPW
jgi:hypothetical protein